MGGVAIVCEVEVAQDAGQAISHSSAFVYTEMPDRTLSVDYRAVSELRQVNDGNGKSEFYPVKVVNLSDVDGGVLKLERQFLTPPSPSPRIDGEERYRKRFQ